MPLREWSILRLDLTKKELRREPVPAAYARLGGRSLSSRIVADEVPALTHPLGPKNKLVLAMGHLAGSTASSGNRLSVGAKSPLTGGIKEANAGGMAATYLGRLGIRALVVEGQAESGDRSLLYLNREEARLEPAGDLAGLGVHETAERLYGRFGEEVALIILGPAAELRLRAAGINISDADRSPTRLAARGGLGAVAGSKGLKAVVIDPAGAPRSEPQDRERYQAAIKAYNKLLVTTPQTSKGYTLYGTAGLVLTMNHLGGLPTRNFSVGAFEAAERISGEFMHDLLKERGGEGTPTHACMVCAIRCSNVFADAAGKVVTSPLEYENISLLGSNLGIGDLDQIARLNYLCNDLGLDTIETGAALGVAAEAGVFSFGDFAAVESLLTEVYRGGPLGRLIGSGAETVGRVYGIRHVPTVKGQAMAAYDPRAIKGMGVTYATSPMGADHTAGATIRAQVDHHRAEGQVEVSRGAQLTAPIYDSIGMCTFSGTAVKQQIEILAELLSGYTGEEWDAADLQALARDVLRTEHGFNRAAGFTPADDRIPEWMVEETNAASGTRFDVPADQLDTLGIAAWVQEG